MYVIIMFFIFILSCLKRGKGGNGGENKGEKGIFITFFNSTYPEISKKIGFRGSAFPFPPLLSLEDGKEERLNEILTNN